jgi:hypothetical protein
MNSAVAILKLKLQSATDHQLMWPLYNVGHVHHLAENLAITDKYHCRIITVVLYKNTRISREVNLEKCTIIHSLLI